MKISKDHFLNIISFSERLIFAIGFICFAIGLICVIDIFLTMISTNMTTVSHTYEVLAFCGSGGSLIVLVILLSIDCYISCSSHWDKDIKRYRYVNIKKFDIDNLILTYSDHRQEKTLPINFYEDDCIESEINKLYAERVRYTYTKRFLFWTIENIEDNTFLFTIDKDMDFRKDTKFKIIE